MKDLYGTSMYKRVLGVVEMDFLYDGYYTFGSYYISDILLAASTYGVFGVTLFVYGPILSSG